MSNFQVGDIVRKVRGPGSPYEMRVTRVSQLYLTGDVTVASPANVTMARRRVGQRGMDGQEYYELIRRPSAIKIGDRFVRIKAGGQLAAGYTSVVRDMINNRVFDENGYSHSIDLIESANSSFASLIGVATSKPKPTSRITYLSGPYLNMSSHNSCAVYACYFSNPAADEEARINAVNAFKSGYKGKQFRVTVDAKETKLREALVKKRWVLVAENRAIASYMWVTNNELKKIKQAVTRPEPKGPPASLRCTDLRAAEHPMRKTIYLKSSGRDAESAAAIRAELENFRPTVGIIYDIVCAAQQCDHVGPILRELGWRLVYMGANATYGNLIETYYLEG